MVGEVGMVWWGEYVWRDVGWRKEGKNVRLGVSIVEDFLHLLISNLYGATRPSPSPFPSPLLPMIPSLPCNLRNTAATSAAATSALVSASLFPTVCNLPNSHASFSIRVRDKISSAART